MNMATLCYRVTFARVVGPEHETKLLVSLVCLIMEEYAKKLKASAEARGVPFTAPLTGPKRITDEEAAKTGH